MKQDNKKLQVLIITQYSLPSYKKNMNAYQRNFYGSEHADITLLVRKKQEISDELNNRVTVHRSPVHNRWLYLVYAILLSGYLRLKGMQVFITEPTGMAAAGFASKLIFRSFWVLDLWDRPQWRPGQHQEGEKRSLYDRLVFWVMGHADLFMLSCLPEAIKDVNPPEKRCAHFINALDPGLFSDVIPKRKEGDALELSFGKSIFDDTVGLSVVIDAAETLVKNNCDFIFHIIGDMASESAVELIENSLASKNIVLHGVTTESRISFFKRIHVGLVPYIDFEDLKYIYPIKVLEHLSQGNPVIASDLPGLGVMVQDGYNGLLVPPNDAEALAQAVQILADDYRLWERMAKNALESIKKFNAYDKNKKMFNTIKLRSTK